jgi:hypothetical protein
MNTKSEPKECCICLNNIKTKKQFKLPWNREYKLINCNHSFHRKCIRKWSKVNKKCPLCQEYFINTYYGYMIGGTPLLSVEHKLTLYQNYFTVYNIQIYYITVVRLFTYVNTIVIQIPGNKSVVFVHRSANTIKELFHRILKNVKESKERKILSVV